MPEKIKNRPRLKNLDDLFELSKEVVPHVSSGSSPNYKGESLITEQPISKRIVTITEISKLTPFRGHPFRLYEGERLEDMVASIKANGVLMPIIVRLVDGILEILSGHNRVEASKLADLDEIPAIILENVTDEDAMAYVVETNLIQRSFTDMCHSEKAAVIALHHSKMFSQGKRNDILEHLETLDKPHEYGGNETCAQVAHKLKSRDVVAKEYGLSKDTVARYLRVDKIIPTLKSYLDDGKIAFIPAVTLSYLKEAEQKYLVDCMERNNLSIDMKKADTLRKYSEKGKLDRDSINRILSGAVLHKPNRTPTVKVRGEVYAKYFKPNQPVKEVQDIVEKALELYFENQ